MRIFGWIFSFLLVSCLVFGYTTINNDKSDKDKLLLEIITYVLDRGHYDPKDIDDSFSENVYMNFLEDIDSHRFFIRADINSFSRFRNKIDEEIKSSDISFFNLVYKKLIERQQLVESFYEDLLEEPFDFTQEESISLNYEKLPYANSVEGLKKYWRKRLKLNALGRYASKKEDEQNKLKNDSTYVVKSDASIEKESRKIILENMRSLFENFNELERRDWFAIYVNSIVEQFDPHTFYFAPAQKDRFDTDMSGKFEGIGARLQKKNQEVKIVEVISGGPVWREKLLEVGDIILKVAQSDVEEAVEISGMRLDDAVKLIKGPKDTKVFLTIKHVDGTIDIVVVTRDVVELGETYAKSSIIIDEDKKYGFIELPKFYIDFQDYGQRNAATDVKSEIEQLKARNVEGLILDLRNNGGGSLKTVVDMTGFFIKEGPVVQVKSTGGAKEVLSDEDPSIVWDGPLVILVNELSASASEIIAAALQDYKRAIVIGSKQTYGKGTVQNVVDLNRIISSNTYGDLGALKITTDKFYRVNGQSTQLEGVKSDVVFPDRYAYIEMGEKDQDNPLEWDVIDSAEYVAYDKMINYEYTVKRSKQRLENNTFIRLIDEQAQWIKNQRDDFDYSLNYETFISEQNSNEEYIKKFEKLNTFVSSYKFEWLEEANSKKEKDDDLFEKKKRWIKSLKSDLYISEAVQVLKDLNIPIGKLPKVAQIKK